ncbi:MAG: GFA family protein, partial [Deltaproteobacteria bacterium]|nr:GFA family protein [Deltaproteobacteria bacterium]
MIARLDPQSLLWASGGSIILCGRSIDMSADEITGGCLCGDVRFYASGPPRRVTHCHCDMCRRAVGAVVATFATFKSSRVDWRGQLARYDSSDRAWRGFC